MTTIIVEIPHQGKASAWVACNDSAIIDVAEKTHNMIYSEWTKENAADSWDEGEGPSDLSGLLKEHSRVIELGDHCEVRYEPLCSAPTEIEHAKELIAKDLYTCFFLSIAEAQNFNCSGHQSIEAKIAVQDALREI